MTKPRPLKLQEDYPYLKELWESSDMKVAPPIDSLPSNGIVLEDNDKIIGAIFIYFTSNSLNAIIGYPIVDQSISENREDIVNSLFDYAEYTVSVGGYKYVHTWSNLNHVKDRLDNRGYLRGDKGVDHFIKLI